MIVFFTRSVFFIDICVLVGLYSISSDNLDKKIMHTAADEDAIPFLRHDECEDDGDSECTKTVHQITIPPDSQAT